MGYNTELMLGSLKDLKNLLMEEGYNSLSIEMNNFIYAIENDDFSTFKRQYKSMSIRGGAGSIKDIDFRDYNKNLLRDEVLKSLKEYKRKTRKQFWRFW